ncbi:MAG: hypothetical protein Q4C91_14685 [Eubacteriales bacterium]|nr:hypothetical protein [Eubacteriales bacterium]
MNRNRKYKKVIAATLCTALTAGAVLPAYGAEPAGKDENVYVNLNQDGSVANIYVVNEYMLEEDTSLVDYGDYSSVKNLSSEEEIAMDNGKVTVNAASGKFFYQGKLKDTELPWVIGISYKLDGREVTAEELAGAAGKLEIQVKVKDNPDSDDQFFDNYLMQATVTLDTDHCKNISAEGATAANVGSDRQLLYNIMAGQEKDFTIKADVTDFEMAAISFQAVPMSFDIDSDSINKDGLTEKTDEVKDAADEFDDGAKELDDGAGELLDGAIELRDGAEELYDGTSSLNSGFGTLTSGIDSLNSGVASVNSGAGSLTSGSRQLSEGARSAAQGSASLKTGTAELSSSLNQMSQGAGELKKGLNTLVKNSGELTEGSAEVKAALTQIQSGLTSVEVGTDQMQELLGSSEQILAGIEQAKEGSGQVAGGLGAIQGSYDSVNALKAENSNAAAYLNGLVGQANAALGSISSETLAKMVEMAGGVDVNGVIGNVSNIAALLEQDNAVFSSLQSGVDQAAAGASAVDAGLETLSSQYKLFNEQVQKLPVILESMISDKMGTLKEAIDQLTEEYGKLDAGINNYTEGVAEIKKGYDTLNTALGQAAAGAETLAAGAENLASGNSSLSAGANELYSGSAALYDGTNSLASGGESLKEGANSASDGVSELMSGAESLKDGAGELVDGVSELKDGTEELLNGTGKFSDEVSDIDDKIDTEIDKAIDEIAGGDYEPVSFVSEKNKNVELVQFVMQTEEISIPEEEEEEPVQEEENVWDKIKHLF